MCHFYGKYLYKRWEHVTSTRLVVPAWLAFNVESSHSHIHPIILDSYNEQLLVMESCYAVTTLLKFSLLERHAIAQ